LHDFAQERSLACGAVAFFLHTLKQGKEGTPLGSPQQGALAEERCHRDCLACLEASTGALVPQLAECTKPPEWRASSQDTLEHQAPFRPQWHGPKGTHAAPPPVSWHGRCPIAVNELRVIPSFHIHQAPRVSANHGLSRSKKDGILEPLYGWGARRDERHMLHPGRAACLTGRRFC